MELIIKEIINLIEDCENSNPTREADRIRNERKCYEDIKNLVENLKGVDECCKS